MPTATTDEYAVLRFLDRPQIHQRAQDQAVGSQVGPSGSYRLPEGGVSTATRDSRPSVRGTGLPSPVAASVVISQP
jgi:hypothetical protein